MERKVMRLLEIGYKSLIISGSIMITNDLTAIPYGRSVTPFGKVARNSAATAGGYLIGKKVADGSWDKIEYAIDKYKEA